MMTVANSSASCQLSLKDMTASRPESDASSVAPYQVGAVLQIL